MDATLTSPILKMRTVRDGDIYSYVNVMHT